MEMTIDEARYLIEHHKPSDVNNAYELGEAFCVAIDTMRKYQKIVPALVSYDLLNPIADVKTIDGEGIYINLSDLQDYIQKVLEDGKTN